MFLSFFARLSCVTYFILFICADSHDTQENASAVEDSSLQNPDKDNLEQNMLNDLWEQAIEVSAMVFSFPFSSKVIAVACSWLLGTP